MRTRCLICLLLLFGILSISGLADEGEIEITWYGHALFTIAIQNGPMILTDPFEPGLWDMGYPIRPMDGIDIVIVSHEHEDHNYYQLATGMPDVLHGMSMSSGFIEVDISIDGVRFYTVSTCHGSNSPCSIAETNAAFVIEANGLRIAHLGDLGHVLTSSQADAIGNLDVLLVPVGGGPTIGAAAADAVIQLLNPAVIIGMHYETPALGWGIDPIDLFLDGKTVVTVEDRSLVIHLDDLPATATVFVLPYE